MQDKERERMTHDTSGQKYYKPFAIYDPDTQSLKTLEDTLLSDSTPFSKTLPVSGMMRNGVLFELPKSERHTKEPGYTSLPTPTVSDTFTANLKSSQQKPGSMHSVTLPQAAKMLPTPVARDYKGDSGYKDNVSAQIKLNWAQFEPAIRQWEAVLNREAPAPLIENQKLNPAFTEWMMGLPEGWITNVEISWTQKIKACGNGVVPQQAKLALTRLIK